MTLEPPVLVTGATGFLGIHLCRELEDRGVPVRAMRRETSDAAPLEDVPCEWVVGDVLDRPSVERAVEGCRTVVHLAGVGLESAGPETVRSVNVDGSHNVFDAAHRADVDTVLFASTAGTRRSDGVADEADVAPPLGPYQASKRRGEELAAGFCDRGLDVVVVHPTSVFGPHDPAFTGRLLSMAASPLLFATPPGGVSVVGVQDVVDGMVAALRRGEPGEHYLLGGENLAFAEAVGVIADETRGYRPWFEVPAGAVHLLGHVAGACDRHLGVRFFPYGPDMARLATSKLFYSSAKAEEELGYRHRPLRALVPDAAEWFRSSAGWS